MKPLIIGIGFRAHSGKGTVRGMIGPMLVKLGGAQMIWTDKFARDLRTVASNFTLEHEDPFSEEFKDMELTLLPMTGGQLLQKLGNGLRGILGDDVWINKVARRTQKICASLNAWTRTCVIIDDVRFVNEAQWIKDQGGYTICVNRLVAQDSHVSETEGYEIPWDYTITNEQDLAHLRASTEEVANSIVDHWRASEKHQHGA